MISDARESITVCSKDAFLLLGCNLLPPGQALERRNWVSKDLHNMEMHGDHV